MGSELAVQHETSAVLKQMEAMESLSVDELRAELGRCVEEAARHIVRLAAIVRLLEDRGEDLSDLKFSMLGHLRKVAYGQLLPEALAELGHIPSLLRKIAGLPTPDQARVIREGVSVGIAKPGGVVDTVKLPVTALTPAQANTVFAHDRVRTPEEQVRQLRFARPTNGEPQPEQPPYTINGNACIVNRPCRLTKRDLQNILKAMG